MGYGLYASPLSPSRLDAWSLSQLGWVTTVPLTVEGDYAFGGAPVSDTTFYVPVTGSNPRGEYFLLENRQPLEADSAMIGMHGGGGLLIWHVDALKIAEYGAIPYPNAVNAGFVKGLELVQADGRGDLDAGRNRGDAGDPYPGSSGNPAFAPVKNQDGTFAGFTMDSIRQVVTSSPGTMTFRLQFGALTVATSAVVSQLLNGTGLTPVETDYLDAAGNHNGQFDVGDFLAWVDATGAPPTAALRTLVGR